MSVVRKFHAERKKKVSKTRASNYALILVLGATECASCNCVAHTIIFPSLLVTQHSHEHERNDAQQLIQFGSSCQSYESCTLSSHHSYYSFGSFVVHFSTHKTSSKCIHNPNRCGIVNKFFLSYALNYFECRFIVRMLHI